MNVTPHMVEAALERYYYGLDRSPETQVHKMLEAALGNVADLSDLRARVKYWASHETPANFRSNVIGLLGLDR